MAWRIGVFLLAAAVVAIGLHPYRREINRYVQRARGAVTRLDESKPLRRTGSEPKSAVPPVQIEIPKGSPKKMDNLTERDREGLSSMIDGIGKGKK